MSGLGFVRVAAAVPITHVGNTKANVREIMELRQRAIDARAQLIVFPELCLTGYTCKDLFLQPALQEAAIEALGRLVLGARSGGNRVDTLTVVGMPLRIDDQLFNVAVVYQDGKIIAIIPKTFIPNYKEFEEGRWFRPATSLLSREITLLGQKIPIGTDIIIDTENIPGFRVGVEVCEDLWMPIPPSSHHALSGATVLVNLSASNALVGKAAYRHDLVSQQSARCIAAYIYTSCGVHESTADVVFDGHAMIAENGAILKESKRFSQERELLVSDIDIERLVRERTLTGSFGQAVGAEPKPCRIVRTSLRPLDAASGILQRKIDPHPFVPSDPATRDERCEEVFAIQVAGLARRLVNAAAIIGKQEVAIGLSGGLDSTLALLATVRTFDKLGWDRSGIHPFTMPGFGTTERTKGNAHRLARALKLNLREASIIEATEALLRAEGHEPCRQCVKCENAQARTRTEILMTHGFVIGTGDLSEGALGWCTYNGDHMSMYNVNAGIPKTLVRHIVRWVAERNLLGEDASAVLQDIVGTPISPELLPPGQGGEIVQRTEDIIGPYDLHDFFLFHFIRNGAGPEKIVLLAQRAFDGHYDRKTILRWLKVFFKRFFFAQFKRNAVPDGPKVGSVSLSPRGDWRMPSDIQGELWLEEVDRL